MFDQILNLVKEHLGNNPQVSNEIPNEKTDAVHREVAEHITDGLKLQVASPSSAGDLLANLSGGDESENSAASSIQSGLVTSLSSKFGLSPAATAAITAAIPGLLQKFANKAKDPNDSSISAHTVMKSLAGDNGLSNLF